MRHELHDDRHVVGNRHRRDLQRVAIDQRGVPVPCRGDAELVHDSGRHAGRRVLGPAGELGEFDRACRRNPSASATATSRAALDDKPAPTGMRGADVSVEPAAAAEFGGDRGDEAPPPRLHVFDVGRHHDGRDVDRFGLVVGHETDPIGG